MIKVYTTPSCSSCRKAKKFFEEENIPYIEKNIFVSELNEQELKDILVKSDNGTDDIISKRSKVIQSGKYDVNNMTISELIKFIKENPSVLKRPIMVDDTKVQVGYNEEEITVFIPHEQRLKSWSCKKEECPAFGSCKNND